MLAGGDPGGRVRITAGSFEVFGLVLIVTKEHHTFSSDSGFVAAGAQAIRDTNKTVLGDTDSLQQTSEEIPLVVIVVIIEIIDRLKD